jgi:hypothetical protein
MSDDRYSAFCRHLLELDSTISFVGLADKFGGLVAMSYRETPFSDDKEVEQYAVQTVLSTLIMEQFEPKAGKTTYTLTAHEKTTRVAIPVEIGNHKLFVLLTMRLEASIIMVMHDKIIPFIASLNLCEQILELDESVTFVGLADKFGGLVAMSYRETPFADEKEAGQYAVHTTISSSIMEQFELKAGKVKYLVAFHEKTARITIPVVRDGDKFYILLIMDVQRGRVSVIDDSITPFIMNALM